jgi:hypothetical protein
VLTRSDFIKTQRNNEYQVTFPSQFRTKRLARALGSLLLAALICSPAGSVSTAADFLPAPQHFDQEIALKFGAENGLPPGMAQLITCAPPGPVRVFLGGKWYEYQNQNWIQKGPVAISDEEFDFPDTSTRSVKVKIPWRTVHQLLLAGSDAYVVTDSELFRTAEAKTVQLDWPSGRTIHQTALKSQMLYVASSEGLFAEQGNSWTKIEALDGGGRDWTAREVKGVGFDSDGRLWVASKAGVGCRTEMGWRFFEGKDGLPWNDFTGIAAGPRNEMWFSTHLGVIRFDGNTWSYRQGPTWLPNDDVIAMTVDDKGSAWFTATGGVGCLARRSMTLQEKADFYEAEIQRYIKRTPLGFVAEAGLHRPPDKSTADPQDSDNDGLWTAMYGAGECFAFAATKEPQARLRAKQAFEALRFLQKVTQDCPHAPPKGFIARTIRPSDWPDPNIGRLQSDLRDQQNDKLWKAYEPRWPRSGDGKWFWKSDTSSDELDGHFFFYPLYFDFCADSDPERERVREVVRDLADHLLSHGFCLVDLDGKPTRWAVYGPQFLNHDPNWWQERGLNSLSILCYLSVATHITGDPKYEAVALQLIERDGYAENAMYPKVQHGPGSGNQSDDEMAFMCYYGLLNCSGNEKLKALIRYSFFQYWVNEAPEMNPFFNFAYAAHNRQATVPSNWGAVSLKPWDGWLEDSMATLYGLPLDRLNWPHRNSHRLDIVALAPVHSSDLDTPDRSRRRGHLVNGKVLPVENRHFNHWNTDPWQLDYGGNGGELAAGTVFLLPYYLGVYHGFIEKPGK